MGTYSSHSIHSFRFMSLSNKQQVIAHMNGLQAGVHILRCAPATGISRVGTIGFSRCDFSSNIRCSTPYGLLCITTEQPDPVKYIAYALHLAIPFGAVVSVSRHLSAHYLVHHSMLRLTTERLFTQGGITRVCFSWSACWQSLATRFFLCSFCH